MLVYRLSEKTVDADGFICTQEADGHYRPNDNRLKESKVIREAVDHFLFLERKVKKQKANKAVDDLLTSLNIRYEYN